MAEELIMIHLPEEEQLNIGILSKLFAKTSESYKYFWMLAILKNVEDKKKRMSYHELVDEMIATAWYMVTEYHLSLGYNDRLERFILNANQKCAVKTSGSKLELQLAFEENVPKEFKNIHIELTKNVPYWLQTPFKKGKAISQYKQMIQWVNDNPQDFMYCFEQEKQTDNTIVLNDIWFDYFDKNQLIIKDWVKYQLILYLEKRNPGVPGIADKLEPFKERKLEDIRKYWKKVITCIPVHEIYTGKEMNEENLRIYGKMSVDHFIPWQYTANDELWNLTPTFHKINSSKNNGLPPAQTMDSLIEQQYEILQLNRSKKELENMWQKCMDKSVFDKEAREKLYRGEPTKEEFKKNYLSIIMPVYSAAKKAGFTEWNY